MAEVNPPYALQNAGATHTALNDRMTLNGLVAGQRTAGSLISRGGVVPQAGGVLSVTQTGSPSMNLLVGSGTCYVPGTEGNSQGLYACTNDAQDTVTITTAHGTLPRIDSVIARVYDSAFSGASNQWQLEVVAGTPASSPVAPTLPANSLRLYNVTVGAAVTSISNANLSDVRTYAAATGGLIIVKDTAERDSLLTLVPSGQGVFVLSTGLIEVKHLGQWWTKSPQPVLKQNQVGVFAMTVNGVWNDVPGAQWPAITFTAPRSGVFTISIGAQLVTGPTHALWMGYRLSGGMVVASTGANAIGATAGTYSNSKEFTFDGATPGTSITVTPQYQVQSGSTGHGITLGQMRVRLEA